MSPGWRNTGVARPRFAPHLRFSVSDSDDSRIPIGYIADNDQLWYGYGAAKTEEAQNDEMARIRKTIGQLGLIIVEAWATGQVVSEVEGLPKEKARDSVIKIVGKR